MRAYQTDHKTYLLDTYPSECPRCRRLIAAIPRKDVSVTTDETSEFLFSCPHCEKLFIGVYSGNAASSMVRWRRNLPSTHVMRSFSLIELISDRFARLYNQSSAAESDGLDEISGTGYRKALEFLIKDYCIALHPADAATIRKKFLKNVIDDYVPDGKLKTAATLTTWLANDEGHYERRWTDKDLKDLKALLELTITFVDEEIQLDQYVVSMKPNDPPRLKYLTTTS